MGMHEDEEHMEVERDLRDALAEAVKERDEARAELSRQAGVAAADDARALHNVRLIAKNAALIAERDEARALLKDAEQEIAVWMDPHGASEEGRKAIAEPNLYQQIATVTAERDRLKAALERYGRHDSRCPIDGRGLFPHEVGKRPFACTCGLDAALTASAGSEGT
jgi:hypothetical protein